MQTQKRGSTRISEVSYSEANGCRPRAGQFRCSCQRPGQRFQCSSKNAGPDETRESSTRPHRLVDAVAVQQFNFVLLVFYFNVVLRQ